MGGDNPANAPSLLYRLPSQQVVFVWEPPYKFIIPRMCNAHCKRLTHEIASKIANKIANSRRWGYVVISKSASGAKFTGLLGGDNYKNGEYSGVKTFAMTAGDEFGVMLVPNGKVQQVFDNPAIAGSKRPLFSMATANPLQGFHVGQIADVTGEGNTFAI